MSQQPPKKPKAAAATRSLVYMVADDREREVAPFLDNVFENNDYMVKRIGVGDFIVLRADRTGPKTLAVFERKTHADFAAGFKDGRYENLSKLLALRAKTGCQVYFIIEGAAFPSPNRKFGRIPYSSIQAAITKMMVRHGVMVEYTENQQHTAKRLADFVGVFAAEEPYAYPTAEPSVAAGGGEDGEDGEDDSEKPPMLLPAEVTARIEDSDQEAAIKAWARLKGISVVLGRILTDRFSVVELILGKVPKSDIEGLKTATGRAINKSARERLLALAAGEEEAAVKVISGVRGISPAIATALIKSAGTARRLLSYTAGAMAIIGIQQKNRTATLGKTRAERILTVLTYKRPEELPASTAPPSAAEIMLEEKDVAPAPEYNLTDGDLDELLNDA